MAVLDIRNKPWAQCQEPLISEVVQVRHQQVLRQPAGSPGARLSAEHEDRAPAAEGLPAGGAGEDARAGQGRPTQPCPAGGLSPGGTAIVTPLIPTQFLFNIRSITKLQLPRGLQEDQRAPVREAAARSNHRLLPARQVHQVQRRHPPLPCLQGPRVGGDPRERVRHPPRPGTLQGLQVDHQCALLGHSALEGWALRLGARMPEGGALPGPDRGRGLQQADVAQDAGVSGRYPPRSGSARGLRHGHPACLQGRGARPEQE